MARAAAFCLVPVAVTGGIHLDGYADLVPPELRHRQGRKHRKGYRDGLQNGHSFSPPL